MRDLPSGHFLRTPVPEDLPRVFAILKAQQTDLHGEADLTLSDLESEWARPSFDLGRDALIVDDEGGPVAYIEVVGTRVSGGVHPAAQDRGIGGFLLGWAIDRARSKGARSVEITAPDADTGLASLLREAGFAGKWASWLFWQALNDDSDAPRPTAPTVANLPEGFEVRNPTLDDARDLYGLIEPAFAEWPDRDPVTFEDWRVHGLEHGDVELATSWLLMNADGEPVGAAMSMTDRGWGWLAELAVRADHRRRGLGSVLLQQCLRGYRDFGLHTGGLGTDSRTGARDLYERNGFVVQRSFTRWSLPLTVAPSP